MITTASLLLHHASGRDPGDLSATYRRSELASNFHQRPQYRVFSNYGVFTPDQDEVLSAAIAGVPRVIELIATVPERSEAAPAGAPNAGAGVDPGLNLIIR